MQLKAQFMSYARLAPIQVNTWGHSETSGIDTIDYFVSSKYFEIEQPQSQYSEKIYLMDSLSTYYYPPSKILLPDNFNFKPRKELNLLDDDHIYGCIQSSFKISEEFEKIMDGILRNDPKAKIILSYYQPFCKSQIERMRRLMGDERLKRIIFLPGMSIPKYLNYIKCFNVMIDPYPFGGCNTSMEAFDLDIPVVTMPTRFLNGRFTFGMYKKMGFIDLVADTQQNYINIAVNTIRDSSHFFGNYLYKIPSKSIICINHCVTQIIVYK
jgi:predicted O-linked N-acetylglucosamine transferase (SPINDLY family)